MASNDPGMPVSWWKPLRMRLSEGLRRVRVLRFSDTFRAMRACDVVVFCGDSDRTDVLDGLAYSRMTDGLREALEKGGVTVQGFALPYARLVGPQTAANAASANRFFFLRSVVDRVCRLIGSTSRMDAAAQGFYARMLKRTGAKSLVGIGLSAAAIKAARAEGARSVEVLHGYGYSAIPWGWDKAGAILPDMVLAFDDVSAATFRQLQPRGTTVCTIENYWYRKFLDQDEFQRLPLAWREIPWLPSGKKVVLVSLSWGYDGDHGVYTFFAGVLKNGLFPDELRNVIELAGDGYFWVFRLHPVQVMGARYAHYKNVLDELCRAYGNCEWERGTQAALPALLGRCDAHISMVSMTAYDAAFLGVCSLMLCPTLKAGGVYERMFCDLEALGFVTRADFDAQRIHAWLTTTSKMPKAYPAKVDTGMPELCALLAHPMEREMQPLNTEVAA